jgi:hypothetical protein
VFCEYWGFPVFLRWNERRLPFSTRQDIVIASFPAITIITRETLFVATIEFVPCLACAIFLAEFVFAVAEGRAA